MTGAARGRRRGLRGVLLRLAVLAGSLVVAALVAELAARVLLPAPEVWKPWTVRVDEGGHTFEGPSGAHSLLLAESPDPELAGLREFRPDLRFRMCYDAHGAGRRPYFDADGCVEIRINSERYRGPLRPKERPAGTFRVAVVGDSFSFGHGVPYEDAWPARLEAGLREHASELPDGCRGAEVIDFAVSGYDADDEARCLRHKALRWNPQVVVYGFFLNDLLVGDAGDEEWDRFRKTDFQKELYGPEQGWAARSRLLGVLSRAWMARSIDRLTRRTYLAACVPGSPHMTAFEAALDDMVAACRDAGVALHVAIFPEITQLDASHPFGPDYAAVRRACEARGVPCVDILPAWLGHPAASLWVHPTDHHPNEIAHALAAQAILDHLLGQG